MAMQTKFIALKHLSASKLQEFLLHHFSPSPQHPSMSEHGTTMMHGPCCFTLITQLTKFKVATSNLEELRNILTGLVSQGQGKSLELKWFYDTGLVRQAVW